MASSTFYTEADLPLATEDVVVTQTIEHGVKIERKVFAGTRVPADLVEEWRDQTGGALSDGEKKAQEDAKTHAEELAKVEKAEADAAPGETPESEQGDPAPARRVPRRAGR